ncbi:hypothetical protein [Rhodopseudomonas sp. B29]|nr:hypothetical protein [Rhodopseudomonas sp. B29]
MADWEANADRSRKAAASQMAIVSACGGGSEQMTEPTNCDVAKETLAETVTSRMADTTHDAGSLTRH